MAMADKTAAIVRLATRKDVPAIAALVRQLAEFENLTHACVGTESDFESSLFNLPPFHGPTVFMLETSPVTTDFPKENAGVEGKSEQAGSGKIAFEESVKEVTLSSAITDPYMAAFRSAGDESRIVVGFVLFFPNYSTFLAKGGYYIEDLYVRKPYRGRGFGSILLKTVAQQAVKLGAGRVEWCVLDWNINAIKFYEGIGATVMPEWRICRLTGDALLKCNP